MVDVVIIGGGVIGCAVAQALSHYQVSAVVLEQCADVGSQTSKANSGIVHAGFDAPIGSVMAEMNVRGNAMMGDLTQQLDVPFQRIGSLVVCLNEDDLPNLEALYRKGLANGVPQLKILNQAELRTMEPNIAPQAVAALYAPTGGIVCPFALTFALAENANVNGVKFQLNTKVTNLQPTRDGWKVTTNRGEMLTRCVVNAAGVYADIFHNMVSQTSIHITPRRGDYCLLDKGTGAHVNHTIFQLPTKLGKGTLVTPTAHGNLLLGPTAIDINDKEGTNTTEEGLQRLLSKAGDAVADLPMGQLITSFAGLRAHEDGHEFILGQVADAPGFYDCAGIESPGLSAAPAIGAHTAELLKDHLNLTENSSFIATRTGILNPKTLSDADYDALLKEHPSYGTIVCRCEAITEGEILDAIHRPLGARTVDGIKRRTRAQMGRCQGGFCTPRILEILARELGLPMSEITKSGGDSRYIVGINKDTF